MGFRELRVLPYGNNMFEKEFIADTETDRLNIDTTNLLMGSGVYVIETGNTYVLNSKQEWKMM